MADSGNGTGVKPTILAFHGSGSNATVHTVQLARLMRVIKSDFEVESLEAPFPSQAGPGVLPFFEGCGPFKRWLKFPVSNNIMRDGTATSVMEPEIQTLVRSTVQRITASGGKVVGLVGFSQGTKVVAGLLKGSELRAELVKKGENVDDISWCDFSFGVVVCGSFPPPLFPQDVVAKVKKATGLSEGEKTELMEKKISTPAFHVVGTQDEFEWAGEALIDGFFEVDEGKSEVRKWDMGHYYPVKAEESEEIGQWIMSITKQDT
ncbi:oxidoreductase [Pyrenophora seminiperda CCB06]|uniref:Oxidoreductase n=1 Tax=Pyrenophora seminiperda CCB06 TaxID=1302712 RepID=A0A3M7LWI7_9PLEO|nr:oxidoreductase [Pyrenophora seminiperda CCB06]